MSCIYHDRTKGEDCVHKLPSKICIDRSKAVLLLWCFVRLFDLCLFGFVGFLFLLVSGKAAVCDSGTPWTFLLLVFFK